VINLNFDKAFILFRSDRIDIYIVLASSRNDLHVTTGEYNPKDDSHLTIELPSERRISATWPTGGRTVPTNKKETEDSCASIRFLTLSGIFLHV
jgi:hypothetical protein